jgi:altronate dehydratase
MFAAGVQIQIFSFGGGLPAKIRGLPSFPPGLRTLPIVKVLGSCDDEDEKEFFDIYAGDILNGKDTIDKVGRRMFELIIQIASGEESFTETQTSYSEMLQLYANGLLM